MQIINQQQLEEKKSSIRDFTLINTLPADKFEQTKITGSINVPQHQDDFVDRVSVAVMNNKQAEIAVYCASRQCDSSAQAARKLEAAGFENVFEYEGGYRDWQEAQQTS